jgi:hypothetical protein
MKNLEYMSLPTTVCFQSPIPKSRLASLSLRVATLYMLRKDVGLTFMVLEKPHLEICLEAVHCHLWEIVPGSQLPKTKSIALR